MFSLLMTRESWKSSSFGMSGCPAMPDPRRFIADVEFSRAEDLFSISIFICLRWKFEMGAWIWQECEEV